MKNILRKLHITQSPPDGPSSPPSPTAKSAAAAAAAGGGGCGDSPQKASSAISSWLNRHASPGPSPAAAPSPSASATASSPGEWGESGSRRRGAGVDVDDEEYQIQVALELSAKEDPEAAQIEADAEEYQIQVALELSAKEDPEAAQIEAVKQISLGSFTPESSPAELLAYRYWSFNALDYDDKVLDGFYDLYGVLSESTLASMPLLVDLQMTPVSDGISWEAVLVNRADDAALVELEQKALMMTLDLKSDYVSLVRSMAMLVADRMGGIVCDPVYMLQSWRTLCNYLRASSGNMVLPLGRLTVGLARHRALLFKVLADNLGIPCRLLKGQQYTGSDDGVLSIVKFKDGREYIVDLMADPGTLIPSDGAGLSRDYRRTVSGNHDVSSFTGVAFGNDSLKQIVTPSSHDSSESAGTLHELRNQECERSSSSPQEFSAQEIRTSEVKILDNLRITSNTGITKDEEPSSRPNRPYTLARSPSWTEGVSSPAVRMMKVKDISQYMINATKENPELAQKLHDVLLESGVTAPPNLFTENCTEPLEDNNYKGKADMAKRSLELKPKNIVDCSHGPFLPDVQKKVIPSGSHLDSLKPVEGLGHHDPLGVREVLSSQIEASTFLVQETPLQFMKHMPVAAAAATAAVVASSMVVAAAKSKNEMNLENPVATAATATAAAVVATTAAVSRQYEYLESHVPAPVVSGGCEDTNKSQKTRAVLDSQLGNDHAQDGLLVPEQDAGEAHQEVERSDRSTGNESTKSDISLEDVAELEIPWEDITLGERIGLGSYGEVYRGEWHGTEIAVKKFLHQDISTDALEEFISEVRIMKRVRHPNVLLLMGAVTRVPNLSIVTEFLPSYIVV